MKNSISIERINMQKTAAHVAYSKGIIDSYSYHERIKSLNFLEEEIIKANQQKAQRLNEMKNKINMYATN
ncbi:hypothetical protein AUC31_00085 [Planococcus rifietoensis]|uniref:Uncharacterized protein n=1 Tax=Planococcus rifietoensis TaxID=200991 RepID=A0A0U2YGG9_9BACL|nr:hypothetical protein [Planococcus rifietoensis]ALS73738.1 hypothetical protein AUC31_00085 [Planococcus rifietoensis]